MFALDTESDHVSLAFIERAPPECLHLSVIDNPFLPLHKFARHLTQNPPACHVLQPRQRSQFDLWKHGCLYGSLLHQVLVLENDLPHGMGDAIDLP